VDFTAKKGAERQDHYQRGPSGFSGTLFNQNFQQNAHSGGPASPRLMISNQMHDVMAGIDTDNFTDQLSGNRMKSKLGNINSSDGDESVDVAERLGQIQSTKLSHEATQGGHILTGSGTQRTGQPRGEAGTGTQQKTGGTSHERSGQLAETS